MFQIRNENQYLKFSTFILTQNLFSFQISFRFKQNHKECKVPDKLRKMEDFCDIKKDMTKYYTKVKSQCDIEGCCHKQFTLAMFDDYDDYYVDKEREQFDFGKEAPIGICASSINRIRVHYERYHKEDSVDDHSFIGYTKGKYAKNKTGGSDDDDSD